MRSALPWAASLARMAPRVEASEAVEALERLCVLRIQLEDALVPARCLLAPPGEFGSSQILGDAPRAHFLEESCRLRGVARVLGHLVQGVGGERPLTPFHQ